MQRLSSRQILRSLSAAEKKQLTTRTNSHGLTYLLRHVTGIAVCIYVVSMTSSYGHVIAQAALGIMLVFLFTAMHEASHKTAFRSAWLNDMVTHFVGFVLCLPPRWFTYFHMAHHQHTHDPEHDPELGDGKPQTVVHYGYALTGIPVWKSQMLALFRNAMGRISEPFIPSPQKQSVMWEARIMLGLYGSVFGVSVYSSSTIALSYWIIPLLLGQPFLRLYLMAEHTGCAHETDMMKNSRTVLTSWPVRMLAWNMPYHAEHHCFPAIPFHQLPHFHAVTSQHIMHLSPTYRDVHRQLISRLDTG